MSPPEVMIDLDNVVFPFMGAFWRWLNTVHPNPMPFSNRSWHFYRDLGVSDDDFARYVREFGETGGFCPPVGTSAPIWPIVDLWERGHRVHIVTARPKTKRVIADTREWLERIGMPHDTLTFSPDKTAFLRFVRSQVTYALDDLPRNVSEMRARGVRAYLFAQPHNERERSGLSVVRSTEVFRARVVNGAD